MNTRHCLFAILALAAVVCCLSGSAQAAPRYHYQEFRSWAVDQDCQPLAINKKGAVTGELVLGSHKFVFLWTPWDGFQILGTLSNREEIEPKKINTRGEIMGGYYVDPDRQHRGFYWSPKIPLSLYPLGTLGGTECWPEDMNNKGWIVGNIWVGIGAFLWTPKTGMQPLDLSSSEFDDFDAYGLNDRGQVVGGGIVYIPSKETHAIIWSKKGVQDLGTLEGGKCAEARRINKRGQVIGWARNEEGGPQRGFFWSPKTGMLKIGTLGGTGNYDHSWCSAINDRGQVLGGSYNANNVSRAFFWSQETGLKDLGSLLGDTGWSGAAAINNLGQVVGWSKSPPSASYPEHAFLWTLAEGMQDLNDLVDLPAGVELRRATAINDKGWIVGWNSNNTGFLLTPLR